MVLHKQIGVRQIMLKVFYNGQISHGRSVVKNSFGILKKMFKELLQKTGLNILFLSNVVVYYYITWSSMAKMRILNPWYSKIFLKFEFNSFHYSLHIFLMCTILDLMNFCSSWAILSHFCVTKNICECGSTKRLKLICFMFLPFYECKYLGMIPIALLLVWWSSCSNNIFR